MDRRKQIFLIYEFLSEQGGLEREIINHANFLKQEGYEIKVLTCHFDKKILKFLPFGGIRIEEISKIKTKFEWLNLALCFIGLNNLKQYNPNLFISYSAPCNYLLRKKETRKVFYINHFPHFLYLKGKDKIEWAKSTQGIKRWISIVLSWILGKYLRKIDKKLTKRNNLIFSNSEFTKKRIDKIYGVNSIVSCPPIDPKIKPSKTKIKESFIFSSSRIIPDKKYGWLIEALFYMKNKIPLYMAGSAEDAYKNKLLNLAEKMKVKIKFLGRLNTEEIRNYYSNAKVFAFPAPKEDFGLVPAESLACGTPVVAWNDGAGPTEQIIDGVSGFLAKPYDLKDFAKKLDFCIDTNFKKKNEKKIIDSAKKFSAKEIRKNFVKEIKKIL